MTDCARVHTNESNRLLTGGRELSVTHCCLQALSGNYKERDEEQGSETCKSA